MKIALAAFAALVLGTPAVRADNGTTAGRFVVEPATLICLGFEWDITGDDNRNATVDVSYRASGQTAWKDGMPLLRMGGEKIFRAPYTVPERFAGSILDLEPDTEYDVRLTMKDPDGVTGQAVQTTKVRTRGEPKAATGGRVLHVYPLTWGNRPKEQPNFTGLMAAYTGYVGTGDWNVVWLHKAEPGDTILVHAGLYKGDRHNYVDPYGLTFDGTYLLTARGTPEKPIVIKAAGDGEVIFDGDGAFRLFDVMGSAYNIFDGITFRNAEVVFWAGVKEVAGAVGLTVRNCRFESVERRRPDAVRRLSGLLHRRQHLPWARRSLPHARLGRSGQLRRASDQQLLRDQDLRDGPRDRAQRHRVLPRRHLDRHARHARVRRSQGGGD